MEQRDVRTLVRIATGVVLLIAVVLGWRSYNERYRVTKAPDTDVAVSQVVRATFAGANDLKVASLTGTVQSVASSTSFGVLPTDRVMKAPFEVEYFVDLSRMGPSDFLWNAQTRVLTVHPPDVTVGSVNVDESRTFIDRSNGLIVTRGAMAAMRQQASQRATAVAGKAARQPERIAAARRNARADLSTLLGGPLSAAGLTGVRIEVVFPGEGARSREQWDVTRSIPEVLERLGGSQTSG